MRSWLLIPDRKDTYTFNQLFDAQKYVVMLDGLGLANLLERGVSYLSPLGDLVTIKGGNGTAWLRIEHVEDPTTIDQL